jgi:hypothetical protein
LLPSWYRDKRSKDCESCGVALLRLPANPQ